MFLRKVLAISCLLVISWKTAISSSDTLVNKDSSAKEYRWSIAYDAAGLLLHALPGPELGYWANAVQLDYALHKYFNLALQANYEYGNHAARFNNVGIRYNGLGFKLLGTLKPWSVMWFSMGYYHGNYWQTFEGKLDAVNFYEENFSYEHNGLSNGFIARCSLNKNIKRMSLKMYGEVTQVNIFSEERVTKLPGQMLKLWGQQTLATYVGFSVGYLF